MSASQSGLRVAAAMAVAFTALAAQSGAVRAAPDFSGMWGRNAFDPELVSDGPTALVNLRRIGVGNRLPSMGGDLVPLVGDYNNPILKPQSAAIVKQKGELSAGGTIFHDPSNQCALYSPPFIFALQLGVSLLQTKNEVVLLYPQDDQVRHSRLNAAHPKRLTPSGMGDSVGHYEGDVLVIDTVGIKVEPYTVVDRYGSPQSEALHLIERYRLIDVEEAKAAQAVHEARAGRVGGPVGAVPLDLNYGQGFQLRYTVDDPVNFTMPWSALVTYRRTTLPWIEQICAENIHEYETGNDTAVPQAAALEF